MSAFPLNTEENVGCARTGQARPCLPVGYRRGSKGLAGGWSAAQTLGPRENHRRKPWAERKVASQRQKLTGNGEMGTLPTRRKDIKTV